MHHAGWMVKLSIYVVVLFSVLLGSCKSKRTSERLVSYNFDVKPILSDRCFNCHGPDEAKREAGLRLDDPKSAYATLEDSPGKRAIVPGRSSRSELIHRIYSEDRELQMPPPTSKLMLSAEEKAILSRWIDQGATYEPHWSFQAPKMSDVPSDLHPIDYFINRKLAATDLIVNPPASAASLIRRASFDLTGLPPTLDELTAFETDSNPQAFQNLVDDLLERPSYGERMAADWMDVARYADSDGYLDDKHRDFSPYRDWVIKAFNENMPYDQFVTWQLAGDLIPDASQESILATAFNRLHRKNSEAGIVFEEYRTEYVADRVHTFGKAFLGLTLECARCHDHKYDPISQKEYYQLFAFFNSTDEMGTAIYGPDQTPGPSLMLTTEAQQEIIHFIEKEIAHQEANLKNATPLAIKSDPNLTWPQIRREYQEKLVAHQSFDQLIPQSKGKWKDINLVPRSSSASVYEPNLVKGVRGQALRVDDYNYTVLGEKVGWYDRVDPFSVTLWLKAAAMYDEAGVFTHCEDLRLGYKGYSLHLVNNKLRFIMAHSWPFNSLEVVSQQALEVDEWSHIALTYDGSSRAEGVSLFLNGERLEIEIIRNNLYKGILYEPNIHTYGFSGFKLGYRDKIKNLKGGAFDEVKIFNNQLSNLAVQYDYDPEGTKEDWANGDFDQGDILDYHRLNTASEGKKIRNHLYDLRLKLNAEVNQIPEIMVLGDLEEGRPTYILERGFYDAQGESVLAQVPVEIGSPITGENANRKNLAEWVFSEDQPLTARVFVNRIWQQHFGQGLVSTPEDFGAQGALPSHPELLDYLAGWFAKSGWNIKALHKLILTSEAYRRDARMNSDQIGLDPKNKWLARGPAKRLTAEMIRDNALAISGLLVKEVGGPSVYPYQPGGLWDEVSNKVWRYPYLQEPGPGLYRRSLYTIWKRTVAPPSMLLFDAPDRSFCTVQRKQTNTPLQALVLLNDPQYVEAARVLSEKAFKLYDDAPAQLAHIFRVILGRHPTHSELNHILAFFKQELKQFAAKPGQAQQYLENGHQTYTGEALVEVATLAQTAHNLMNSYEAQMAL